MKHMGLDTVWQQLVPPPKKARPASLRRSGHAARELVRAYPLRSQAARCTKAAADMAEDPQPKIETAPVDDDTVRQYVCNEAPQGHRYAVVCQHMHVSPAACLISGMSADTVCHICSEECYDASWPPVQLTQAPGCWADAALPRIYRCAISKLSVQIRQLSYTKLPGVFVL